MLTEQELHKIFSWLPYRENWPVDRNQSDDNVDGFFVGLITSLTKNKLFDTYYSQDGGMTNYLEFICYPTGNQEYDGPAIMVCVSLCAPIATYGQTSFHKTRSSWSYSFIKSEMVRVVSDNRIKEFEQEIKNILSKNNLILMTKEFASQPLPKEVGESIRQQNLNEGDRYLHGIFQYTD